MLTIAIFTRDSDSTHPMCDRQARELATNVEAFDHDDDVLKAIKPFSIRAPYVEYIHINPIHYRAEYSEAFAR